MNRTIQPPDFSESESIQPPMIYVKKAARWEYKIITRQLTPVSLPDESALNELGQDGWELAGIFQEASSVHFYFKRLTN